MKTIQELLGHSTMNMTMAYAHLAPEVKRMPCSARAPEVEPQLVNQPKAFRTLQCSRTLGPAGNHSFPR
jgi:hypothetical protein